MDKRREDALSILNKYRTKRNKPTKAYLATIPNDVLVRMCVNPASKTVRSAMIGNAYFDEFKRRELDKLDYSAFNW